MKKMKKVALIVLTLFAFSILASCSYHLGNFSALATGTYRSENIRQENLVARNAKGGSSALVIFGIPLSQPKIDQAVAEALTQNGGDFMQNARVYYRWWSLGIIGEVRYDVEGDVYKTLK